MLIVFLLLLLSLLMLLLIDFSYCLFSAPSNSSQFGSEMINRAVLQVQSLIRSSTPTQEKQQREKKNDSGKSSTAANSYSKDDFNVAMKQQQQMSPRMIRASPITSPRTDTNINVNTSSSNVPRQQLSDQPIQSQTTATTNVHQQQQKPIGSGIRSAPTARGLFGNKSTNEQKQQQKQQQSAAKPTSVQNQSNKRDSQSNKQNQQQQQQSNKRAKHAVQPTVAAINPQQMIPAYGKNVVL